MVVFPDVIIDSFDQFMTVFVKLLVNMRSYDSGMGHGLLADTDSDPKSIKFSFPIGGQAWFLPIGYSKHPSTNRRIGHNPFMIINNHVMFNKLKSQHTHDGKTAYSHGKKKIHQRLEEYHGGVHYLLADFGNDLEFPQYLLPPKEQETQLWQLLYEIGGLKPFG